MTVRNAKLFDGTRAASFLRSQWITKGGALPLSTAEILEPDRSANRFFRTLWQTSFPTRDPLPFGPLANADGTGSEDFWTVFS